MRRWLVLVYVNFANLCVLLVVLEGGAQLLRYLKLGELLLATPPTLEGGRIFEIHPYLVGRPRPGVDVEQAGTRITTTLQSTRTVPGADPAAPLRVAVLGGSTTFCVGESDADTWPARLQAALGPGYGVVNFGVPGYSTAEAVIQMSLLVPESRPQVVVFYEGWNDIRSYHAPRVGPDSFEHGLQQYSSLGLTELPPDVEPRALDRLAQVSVIARLARRLSRFLPRRSPAYEEHDTPDERVDRIYLRNLRTLRLLARSAGARALFVPQVLNEAGYARLDRPADWSPHIAPEAVPRLMKRFNGFLAEACEAGAEDCRVLDGIDDQPWVEADFIDLGHFSAQGSEKFARLLVDEVRELAGGS